MNSDKKIFYLKDFCKTANLFNNELLKLESIINIFLSKKKQVTYLENPFNTIYIYESIFDKENKSLNYNELYTEFNNKLNIKTNLDLTIIDDILILKDYTYPMFQELDKIFISDMITNADINWFYNGDINGDISNKDIVMSVKIADNHLYKNTGEVFSSITVNSDKTNALPSIKNLTNFFNLKSNKIITCEKGDVTGDNFTFKDGTFSSQLPLTITTNTIDQSDITLPLSNIDSNDTLFIKRNLSNVSSLNIKMNSSNYEDDDVLNNTAIDNLFQDYKNTDDTTIDSSYKISISKESDQAVTAKKALSIIKTHIEEYYLDVLESNLDNLPASNIAKVLYFYKKKVEEMESTYLLIKDYALTDFYLYDNFCLKASYPFTLKKQKECIDSNVSIEDSKRILTKNTFKCWLKQCLNERIGQQ